MSEMETRRNHKAHNLNLDYYNGVLRDKSPEQIIEWALYIAERPVITSNFRPYATVLIHACSRQKPDITVIWCDTGFNTQSTYTHIEEVVRMLKLNLYKYKPTLSKDFIGYYYGIPSPNNRLHSLFSELVKLEPFRRAMEEHKPDIWFTNVRRGQTEFRNGLDILSYSKEGILKVSPFYYANTKELYTYTQKYSLPIEFDYFDPTKGEADMECGMQLM